MTSDPNELERLSKAAEQEDDDVRYYGGPTSTHRPARDAYHAALVQLHRTGQLVPAMPSGDVTDAAFEVGQQVYERIGVTPAMREVMELCKSNRAATSQPSGDEVEAVAELQLAAFLAGRGSVVSMEHGTRTAKPAPTMDEFRQMARTALDAARGKQ